MWQAEDIDAVFAQETEGNNGGGRVVFNSENLAFYLQKDYDDPTGDEEFYDSVKRLALASLEWSGEILTRAADAIHETDEATRCWDFLKDSSEEAYEALRKP